MVQVPDNKQKNTKPKKNDTSSINKQKRRRDHDKQWRGRRRQITKSPFPRKHFRLALGMKNSTTQQSQRSNSTARQHNWLTAGRAAWLRWRRCACWPGPPGCSHGSRTCTSREGPEGKKKTIRNKIDSSSIKKNKTEIDYVVCSFTLYSYFYRSMASTPKCPCYSSVLKSCVQALWSQKYETAMLHLQCSKDAMGAMLSFLMDTTSNTNEALPPASLSSSSQVNGNHSCSCNYAERSRFTRFPG